MVNWSVEICLWAFHSRKTPTVQHFGGTVEVTGNSQVILHNSEGNKGMNDPVEEGI